MKMALFYLESGTSCQDSEKPIVERRHIILIRYLSSLCWSVY